MGGGSARAAPPVFTPTPKVQDKAVQDAVAAEMQRRSRANGFRSTILSRDFLDAQSAALQQTFGR